MTIHWFFTFGTGPQPATYLRSESPTPIARRRFVTTALLEMGWPVPHGAREGLVLHLLPTGDLSRPYPGSQCKHCSQQLNPPAPSPREQFERELEEVAPELVASLRCHEALEKRDRDAIWRVVRTVLEAVGDGDSIVLETTNGIRSITTGFLLASGLLLAHRKNVSVLGVPYAEFGAEGVPEDLASKPGERGSPVIDLIPFLRLFDWSHAVRAMSQYLDPTPTLGLLKSTGSAALSPDAEKHLRDLGAALALNFPVEIEHSLTAWRALGTLEASTPAATIALTHIGGALAHLIPHGSKATADEAAPLDASRLEFDLALIVRLIEAQRLADAARALREWIVNAVIVAWNEGDNWLKQPLRARAEAALHGISSKGSATTQALKELWLEASKYRNAVSHLRYNEKHEIDPDALRVFLEGVVERVRALRRATPNPFTLPSGTTRRYLANAFSLNMLSSSMIHAKFTALSANKARTEAQDRESVVGHAETASLFASLLGRAVVCRRETLKLERGDTLLVGQYDGPRLAEGATTLPSNARISWFLVELF